ncbi:MAG: hypothetical protein HRU09_16235 [Oligoflexales bacterium]|nr:hypothetical protein [Oligoflexales bacterium]
MEHGLISLILLLGLGWCGSSFAGEARLQALGPAGIAVLNSTHRPILPYHINGLTKDAKVGGDLGYRNQTRSLVDTKSKLTQADVYVYGSVPLFSITGRARPSGIIVKVSSNSYRDISSYQSFEWEDEQSVDNLIADLGFVLAPSSAYMFSFQVSIDQRKETSKQTSQRDINGEIFERRQSLNKSASIAYAEIGYRLKLTRETSMAAVYKPGSYSKSGTHVKEENSFINQNEVVEYNESAYSQGFVSVGFKTRASRFLTLMLGVEKFFEVKNRNETGNGELLAEEFSNLGIAGEYRIAAADKKIWIPRLGFEAQSNGENKFSAGLSMESKNIEAEFLLASIQGSSDEAKKSEFQMILGLGYRIQAEDAED